jgi:hypothetical protein
MKLVRSFDVPAPVPRVAAAYCSEAYNVEAERSRPEVVSTAYHAVERDAQHVVFEIRSVEHKRTKIGGIDRSGTLESVTRMRWDEGRSSLSWTYSGAAGRRVSISGVYQLQAKSDSETEVVHELAVEVSIPLLGNQIAKLIAREFESTAPRYEQMLRRHAARLTNPTVRLS